ncbi:MAG: diaminopimelate epimerase [Eubacteriales bacterium]|nr:diaminopimelate epimerase [Eubacteriales bacterium]
MKLSVTKYHGCGNDFIITGYKEAVEKYADIPRLVREICDRHTGIGADGMILVKEDPLEMVYYNQDGSRAPMCGNGIRCFAAYCYDEFVCREVNYPVATLAGEMLVKRISEDPFLVQIEMGEPDYAPEKIGVDPALLKGELLWGHSLKLSSGKEVKLCSFFLGTIHTIVFADDAFGAENEAIGREICHHPLFSEQTNVNFVHVADDAHINLQTYERGCGMTLACGTGASASALCTYKLGLTGPSVEVRLPKGSLHIDVHDGEKVRLTGPAVRIMSGVYEL